jgi:hypothetical protein
MKAGFLHHTSSSRLGAAHWPGAPIVRDGLERRGGQRRMLDRIGFEFPLASQPKNVNYTLTELIPPSETLNRIPI